MPAEEDSRLGVPTHGAGEDLCLDVASCIDQLVLAESVVDADHVSMAHYGGRVVERGVAIVSRAAAKSVRTGGRPWPVRTRVRPSGP
jgi:hypothetical protein